MSSGELRHFVSIQEPTEAAGANGDYAEGTTWANLATNPEVWARIIYEKVQESSSDRDYTQSKAVIKIRHRTDITNRMRIVYGSEIFDIENSFDPSGRGAYLMIPVLGAE